MGTPKFEAMLDVEVFEYQPCLSSLCIQGLIIALFQIRVREPESSLIRYVEEFEVQLCYLEHFHSFLKVVPKDK